MGRTCRSALPDLLNDVCGRRGSIRKNPLDDEPVPVRDSRGGLKTNPLVRVFENPEFENFRHDLERFERKQSSEFSYLDVVQYKNSLRRIARIEQVLRGSFRRSGRRLRRSAGKRRLRPGCSFGRREFVRAHKIEKA